jgi:hypothetical protein
LLGNHLELLGYLKARLRKAVKTDRRTLGHNCREVGRGGLGREAATLAAMKPPLNLRIEPGVSSVEAAIVQVTTKSN